MKNLEHLLLKSLKETILNRFDGCPLKLPKERKTKENRLDQKIKFLKNWLKEIN